VRHDATERLLTTTSGTRVHTFAVQTGSVASTVGAAHTLGSTVRWCAYEISETRAAGTLCGWLTLWVGTTGWGQTRIHFDGISGWWWYNRKNFVRHCYLRLLQVSLPI